MKFFNKQFNLIVLSLALVASQSVGTASALAADLDQWIQTQSIQSRKLMLADISRPGAAKGSVVAAPAEGGNPNYYFHWVRDAALVMDAVVSLIEKSSSVQDTNHYSQILTDFVSFSTQIQNKSNLSGNPWDTGPGEPKFNVDGSDFTGDWGRPQNDGPAIRASTLMRLGNLLIDQGQIKWVQDYLYNSSYPVTVILKADLEFIAHHWREPSFDLWEEVKGSHFYTQMVQRRALLEGSEFALRMGDSGAATFYQGQAQEIEQEILLHWNSGLGYIVETLNYVSGVNTKSTGIDVAVVLGVLHGTVRHQSGVKSGVSSQQDSFFTVIDDRVIATALKIKQVFQTLYPINQRKGRVLGAAPGIGRYPEDRYNGYTTSSLGNPWFLATNAFAELYYNAATQFEQLGAIEITPTIYSWIQDLPGGTQLSVQQGETLQISDANFQLVLAAIRSGGDEFLKTTETHVDGAGNISEEFNRSSGNMQGAENLTWSHASLLTAVWARGN